MGKGIVKSIKQSGGAAAATATVGATMEGMIQDAQDPTKELEFMQPFGEELGLVIGSKVNYNSILVGGKPLINTVRLIERGLIETLNETNDGGTLLDKASRKVIPFSQLYCRETGLVAPSGNNKGSAVSFERIVDARGNITATALEIIR